MKFRELEVVVLERDHPEDGLCRGDLGTVVALYEPDGLEVEFVTVTGRTHALVTLHPDDLRPGAGPENCGGVERLRRRPASVGR